MFYFRAYRQTNFLKKLCRKSDTIYFNIYNLLEHLYLAFLVLIE